MTEISVKALGGMGFACYLRSKGHISPKSLKTAIVCLFVCFLGLTLYHENYSLTLFSIHQAGG